MQGKTIGALVVCFCDNQMPDFEKRGYPFEFIQNLLNLYKMAAEQLLSYFQGKLMLLKIDVLKENLFCKIFAKKIPIEYKIFVDLSIL